MDDLRGVLLSDASTGWPVWVRLDLIEVARALTRDEQQDLSFRRTRRPLTRLDLTAPRPPIVVTQTVWDVWNAMREAAP